MTQEEYPAAPVNDGFETIMPLELGPDDDGCGECLSCLSDMRGIYSCLIEDAQP